MGGTMKGAQSHGHMHGGGRRRWSNVYVVMVIVCCVFGCGLLGLMGLHRLRERRSLNLLIKQKDDQILSLHLLLQKESEEMVEVKKKTEEMKMKILRLGSHKAELNSRILEMESSISSLREEQRTVESAFQEKQNEANLMREKYTQQLNYQNPQLEALKEELRHKQGEIEDLKRRLQPLGAEVGSVRLILPSNATAEANTTESEAKVHENERDGETESSTTSTETIHTSSENGGTNADRTSDEAEPKSKEEHENGKIADLGNEDHAQTQSSDNQELGVDEGWKKMEMQENSRRFRGGKRGYLRRAKGKRWRSIGTEGKRTTSLSKGASTMADKGTLSARRNSSSESTHASIEEPAKNSASKMDGVQHTEENEHLGEQISITKKTEDENGQQQHTELLGRKEVSGRNGEEQNTVQSRDSEESEDREETDEPEFEF